MSLRSCWSGLPAWVRVVLAGYAIGFLVGTLSHLFDVIRYGDRAYSAAPLPLRIFFVSLVLLDPLAAALVLSLRKSALWLACLVMLADMAANWWLTKAESAPSTVDWTYWGRLALQTVFGLGVFVTAIPLWRRLRAIDGQDGRNRFSERPTHRS